MSFTVIVNLYYDANGVVAIRIKQQDKVLCSNEMIRYLIFVSSCDSPMYLEIITSNAFEMCNMTL